MSKLVYSPIGSIADHQGKEQDDWVCQDRLPEGVTLLTGIAGSPCSKKLLESVALGMYAEYAERGEVAGEQAREGTILYVQLEGSEQKLARRLRSVFEDDVSESALAGVWPGKMSMEMAEAIGECVEDADCGIVIVDGAQAGCEGRQKLSTVLSDLDRRAKAAGCAVVALLPLTKRNMFCAKDPATGIWDACEAVWEIYADAASAVKCFCTTKSGGATAFELKTASGGSGRRGAGRQMPTAFKGAAEVSREERDLEVVGEEQNEDRVERSWGEE